ncbi:hypothetical protein G7Y89_g15125 [Cudoniella acicularis]|uniref:Uncharacterized protein n=1 Tax=Cudoniella acicularis TaxID=354080 RepID=A0A8H4QTP4_9HELO|nr:hypothetical protein G7Y89_g15125 [Cudoniella acicularis]
MANGDEEKEGEKEPRNQVRTRRVEDAGEEEARWDSEEGTKGLRAQVERLEVVDVEKMESREKDTRESFQAAERPAWGEVSVDLPFQEFRPLSVIIEE